VIGYKVFNPKKEPATSELLRRQSAFCEGGGSGGKPEVQGFCRFVWNHGGCLQEGQSLEARTHRAKAVREKRMERIACVPRDMSPALRELHDLLYSCCVERFCIFPVVLQVMQAREYQILFAGSRLFRQ